MGSLRLTERPHVRKARLWVKLSDGKEGWVRCDLCQRRCVIAPGKYGACGVRKNIGGELYTLVYGLLSASNIDPIEKKPLLHFYPGSTVLSISTVGCNFFCQFCQNFEISQSRLEKGLYGVYRTPEEVVRLALVYGADGITYTYNEPTIFFETVYDVAKEAKKHGLFNTMVTNGYMTPEAVDELGSLIDAATVDFKGGGDPEFYRKIMFVPDPEPIYEAILAMKDKGWWIEITNLVVPILGDKPEYVRRMARWIVENLGPEVPFHLLRFHPDYKLRHVPHTPVKTLEKLARIAMEEGLKHVYIGNVWGHPLEDTYCPKCGYKVVDREGFAIVEWRLTSDFRCPRCGYKLNFRGEYTPRNINYPMPVM
ncbi:PflA homolog [Aeropyrum pernix K1]|uniref:PflA homolog n=1 Tax=Aeropyrum pernix (strain ATCC 700893 / DSM 11879 / JCM 9820 / NBRC 100138 / K1) TaxID=272557 RepID=Q9YAS8_AERPE|nr:AmmeMemoRadiSam system radical SAM enzyme [Aeropyrum pernix]BAA80870.2 PflA homolog [Aeropyrum pernix K1]